MSQMRCFVAIEIPGSIQRKIGDLQSALRPLREHISWTRPANIHLTLKFLGDVDVARTQELIDALTSAVVGQSGFSYDVAGLGMFPNERRPRVLWVGVADSEGALNRLAKNVNDALIQFGFSRENRKFTPHLTVGRIKSPPSRKFIEQFSRLDFNAGRGRVDEIVLMRSQLKPGGAVYTPLKKIGLT